MSRLSSLMSAMSSEGHRDIITFDAGMEFFDLGGQFTHGWEDPHATSPTGEGARMTYGATNPRSASLAHGHPRELGNPIIDWAAPGMHGYFPSAPPALEGPDSLLGLYDLVTDNAQCAPLVDTSGFDYAIDRNLFSAVDPPLDNSLFLNTGATSQYNTALHPSAYPEVAPGYSYPVIAPATTNPLVPPNASSGAHVGAQHRVIDTRIRCTAPGCSKTFRRVGDCRRHMRKHQAPKLTCIVEGCDMKFTRLDKVRDHLRQGHKIVL